MSAIRNPAPAASADIADAEPVLSPALARCLEAFERDLSELLKTHPRRWVAYANGSRVRIADTQTEVYRHCLYDLGLRDDEFIVACIVPDSGGAVEYTLR
jgi:hypothetical protein